MMSMHYEDEVGKSDCPYCSSSKGCEHILLLVDRTFRIAEGGRLMQVFNERWSNQCEKGGDDFDEREQFQSLLDEVDSLADFSADFDHEGGPGMSSSYSIYYVKPAEKSKEVVQGFSIGSDI